MNEHTIEKLVKYIVENAFAMTPMVDTDLIEECHLNWIVGVQDLLTTIVELSGTAPATMTEWVEKYNGANIDQKDIN